MKKFILLIVMALLIGTVAIAQISPDCRNDSRRTQMGDYCMIVIPEGFIEGIPGYYPIGAYLEFPASDGAGEIGRIQAYVWNVTEQRYHYYVVTRPVVGNRIYPLTDVSPDVILRSSEALYQ